MKGINCSSSMETKTNDDASKHYSPTNQNHVRDGISFDDNKDVSSVQLGNSCRNHDLNVPVGIPSCRFK